MKILYGHLSEEAQNEFLNKLDGLEDPSNDTVIGDTKDELDYGDDLEEIQDAIRKLERQRQGCMRDEGIRIKNLRKSGSQWYSYTTVLIKTDQSTAEYPNCEAKFSQFSEFLDSD